MTGTSDIEVRRATPLALAAAFAIVLLTSWGGIELTLSTGRVASIWISNAILLAFLMRTARADWGKLLAAGWAANFAADLLVGDPALRASLLPLCNTAEILAVALPMRFWKLDGQFTKPRALLVFYALAAGAAPVSGGVLAALYLHFAEATPFWDTMIDWYASDALGLIIVAPLLVTVRYQALKAMFGRDQIVLSLQMIGLVLAAAIANLYLHGYPIAFLFFPMVMLLTFQRGFAGGAIGLAIATAYMLVPVLIGQGSGGLRGHSLREQVILVEIFAAVIGFSVTLVGAALQERRRLEHGLAKAIERAELAREEALVARDASEKANRAKSMFLANMSHELRTPLNAVIGFAELMHVEMYGPLGDPHYREYTGMIQSAGRHLLDLINDILDMSKIEAGKFDLDRERISLSGLVSDCVALMSERAQHGEIDLTVDIAGAPQTFLADRRAMKQILLNLLSNAIKFTPAGGRVGVRARSNGNMLIMSITDTGVGIPADQLYRLGNPFVQLRTNAGATQNGTGLGLALVRALAELHHGALRIESVEGRGTTASIEIPMGEAASLAA
ncbi:MAG TPA: ATP-binding protein [Rhizomicrobium sp.]|nr:ATP-binding protein [Rhizomicrobium sp.]